ncbi:MAG TPA: ABC transporter permease subunit [Acidimicrobiales bacterium]|nr:ABC transporter permease subunit [Acidimicrobiales bacterium]
MTSCDAPGIVGTVGRASMRGLLRSEWAKLRTVRSTGWILGTTVLVGLAASAAATAVTRVRWPTEPAASRAAFDPVEVSLMGTYLAGSLLLGVLGILVVSSEYSTGTIRATLAASPRRLRVLAAKVIVFGAVSLVVSEIVALAGFLVGQALLSSPAPHATLSSPGALRAIGGTGFFLCLVGLFGLGIAAAVRHTAGAISIYAGVLLVLPVIFEALPGSLQYQVERLQPLTIGSVMVDDHVPHAFGPWGGLAVVCGYTALALGLGAVLMARRDA